MTKIKHAWIRNPNGKSTCIKCGCTKKQLSGNLILYILDNIESSKSPNCKESKII